MKHYVTILSLAAVVFVGCKKDKDDEDNTPSKDPDYTAIEITDNLNGQINAKDWVFESGNTDIWDFGSYEEDPLFMFSLRDTTFKNINDELDTCYNNGSTSIKNSKVLFSIKKSKLSLGIKEFSLSNEMTATLVFYEDGNTTPQNYVVTDGFVDITSIDTTNQHVITGNIDAYYERDMFVKGTFSVKVCD